MAASALMTRRRVLRLRLPGRSLWAPLGGGGRGCGDGGRELMGWSMRMKRWQHVCLMPSAGGTACGCVSTGQPKRTR
jgi:hypothetical protein